MKTSYFYSASEIKEMKELIRTGEPLASIADREHSRFNATRNAFYTKLIKLSRSTRKVKEWDGPKRRRIGVRAQPVEGTSMPEGFAFEGTPKKVTFCVDHFRVYF